MKHHKKCIRHRKSWQIRLHDINNLFLMRFLQGGCCPVKFRKDTAAGGGIAGFSDVPVSAH